MMADMTLGRRWKTERNELGDNDFQLASERQNLPEMTLALLKTPTSTLSAQQAP
jgi:hypothetical protein